MHEQHTLQIQLQVNQQDVPGLASLDHGGHWNAQRRVASDGIQNQQLGAAGEILQQCCGHHFTHILPAPGHTMLRHSATGKLRHQR